MTQSLTSQGLQAQVHLTKNQMSLLNGRRIPASCSRSRPKRRPSKPPASPLPCNQTDTISPPCSACRSSCILRSSHTLGLEKMHHTFAYALQLNISTTPYPRSITRICSNLRIINSRKNDAFSHADTAYVYDAPSCSPTSSRDAPLPIASALTVASITRVLSQVPTTDPVPMSRRRAIHIYIAAVYVLGRSTCVTASTAVVPARTVTATVPAFTCKTTSPATTICIDSSERSGFAP